MDLHEHGPRPYISVVACRTDPMTWHCLHSISKKQSAIILHRMAWKTSFQVTTLLGASIGSWFAGYSFQKTPHKSHYCSSCDDALDESFCERKHFPALPIFGSVSAASPIEKKLTSSEENAVPHVPLTTNRVSQMMKNYRNMSLSQKKSIQNKEKGIKKKI
uniref:Uncharacterized protein n=1 Tax=Timema genevievae TaxID=629358 RepID=A0A7R9JSI3_TIMGE|nr:unnamed protein product [Timema genevievae]